MNIPKPIVRTLALLAVVAFAGGAVAPAHAQDRPSERQLRTYIPPDELVSFLPSTPFGQFVEFLSPIFERVTGKTIVDPESRTESIGVSIMGMQFIDALELVLEYNGLTYRETDRFFIVEPAPEQTLVQGPMQTGVVPGAAATQGAAETLATLGTREMLISAVLFDLNLTKARELGLDWNVFFGTEGGSGGSGDGGTGGGGGNGGGNADTPRFILRTDQLFDRLDDYLLTPDQIDISTLTQFFRLLESEGVGETIANPTITVQSGEPGRIQIGSDVPVQTRDFAGNTVTTFFSTGIIVDVTPTLLTEALADSVGSALLDFIHLNVLVDKSSSRPSQSGPIIDRNQAKTQVLLLDGEQTVIGGLYSTEQTSSRRGIPVLKDLPPWFFGLRYIFGYEQEATIQRELLIVLQAEMLDPLEVRASRPFADEVIEGQRRRVRENLRRVDEGLLRGGPPAGTER